jgi:hypothetical protein
MSVTVVWGAIQCYYLLTCNEYRNNPRLLNIQSAVQVPTPQQLVQYSTSNLMLIYIDDR